MPTLADLNELSVDVNVSDQSSIVTVTHQANDGSEVDVSWDETAASVDVRWRRKGREVLTLTRELASKVSIREERGVVEFRVWTRSTDTRGELLVRVAEHVTIEDSLLEA